MAWENPKTNWGQPGQTVPGVDDFNRIEGNINELNEKKANKPSTYTSGNFVSFGQDGSFTDSNKKAGDFAPASHASNKNNPHEVTTEQIGALAKLAKYYSSASYDLNTLLDGIMLVSNAVQNTAGLFNLIDGPHAYIFQIFYNSVSETSPRTQIAFGYSSDNAAFRRYNNPGVWSAWSRIFTDNNIIPISNGGTGATTAAQALSNLGLKFFRFTTVLDRGTTGVFFYTGLPDTYRYISHSIIDSPVYPIKSISVNNYVEVRLNQVAEDNTALDIVVVAFQINVT